MNTKPETRRKYYRKNKALVLAINKHWNQQNHPAVLAYHARWRADNRYKIAGYARKRKYGITNEKFEAMLIEQNYCCELCKKPFEDIRKLRPVVDHDHNTGMVRALLHKQCNIMLGIIESREFHDNAERYIDEQARKIQSGNGVG